MITKISVNDFNGLTGDTWAISSFNFSATQDTWQFDQMKVQKAEGKLNPNVATEPMMSVVMGLWGNKDLFNQGKGFLRTQPFAVPRSLFEQAQDSESRSILEVMKAKAEQYLLDNHPQFKDGVLS